MIKDTQNELIKTLENLTLAVNKLSDNISRSLLQEEHDKIIKPTKKTITRRHFKIDSYTFKDEIDKMLRNGATFKEVEKFISTKGENCSHASIGRYYKEQVKNGNKL